MTLIYYKYLLSIICCTDYQYFSSADENSPGDDECDMKMWYMDLVADGIFDKQLNPKQKKVQKNILKLITKMKGKGPVMFDCDMLSSYEDLLRIHEEDIASDPNPSVGKDNSSPEDTTDSGDNIVKHNTNQEEVQPSPSETERTNTKELIETEDIDIVNPYIGNTEQGTDKVATGDKSRPGDLPNTEFSTPKPDKRDFDISLEKHLRKSQLSHFFVTQSFERFSSPYTFSRPNVASLFAATEDLDNTASILTKKNASSVPRNVVTTHKESTRHCSSKSISSHICYYRIILGCYMCPLEDDRAETLTAGKQLTASDKEQSMHILSAITNNTMEVHVEDRQSDHKLTPSNIDSQDLVADAEEGNVDIERREEGHGLSGGSEPDETEVDDTELDDDCDTTDGCGEEEENVNEFGKTMEVSQDNIDSEHAAKSLSPADVNINIINDETVNTLQTQNLQTAEEEMMASGTYNTDTETSGVSSSYDAQTTDISNLQAHLNNDKFEKELLMKASQEYSGKIKELEIQILKLENVLLHENLHKHNNMSTFSKLENHILKLENELLRINNSFTTLKVENDNLKKNQKVQESDLALVKQQSDEGKYPMLADNSSMISEVIVDHQNKITELANLIYQQSSYLQQLEEKSAYVEEQNRFLVEQLANQSKLVGTILQKITNISTEQATQQDLLERTIKQINEGNNNKGSNPPVIAGLTGQKDKPEDIAHVPVMKPEASWNSAIASKDPLEEYEKDDKMMINHNNLEEDDDSVIKETLRDLMENTDQKHSMPEGEMRDHGDQSQENSKDSIKDSLVTSAGTIENADIHAKLSEQAVEETVENSISPDLSAANIDTATANGHNLQQNTGIDSKKTVPNTPKDDTKETIKKQAESEPMKTDPLKEQFTTTRTDDKAKKSNSKSNKPSSIKKNDSIPDNLNVKEDEKASVPKKTPPVKEVVQLQPKNYKPDDNSLKGIITKLNTTINNSIMSHI